MIATKEIRVGNWFHDVAGSFQFQWQVSDWFFAFNDSHENMKQFEPIKLTGEWLTRFGYTFNGESWFCPNKVIGLTRYFNFLIWPPSGGGGGGYFGQIEIKYVHQLQNLHFSLTGQELTTSDHGQTPL